MIRDLGAFFAPPPAVEANSAAVKRPPPVPLRGKESPADGSAKNRALRGYALSRSGLSTPHCFVPRLNPSNPLRTNRRAAFAERVLVCRPPLNWIFVKPDSGARRVAAIQQHASRDVSGANPLRTNRQRLRRMGSGVPAPVEMELCGTGIRSSP
jgi:hypothetical protein